MGCCVALIQLNIYLTNSEEISEEKAEEGRSSADRGWSWIQGRRCRLAVCVAPSEGFYLRSYNNFWNSKSASGKRLEDVAEEGTTGSDTMFGRSH